ncbi:MAG TPA: N-methyl-L-tryptophan oxidase [Candidatus Acidoferrum sp.]|nr:N-methyl-L-tryptophan oxidase [Candidatus Acidoferrum sp.]
MHKTADVIVIGCGAVGSASLYQLAKRGVKVLGIDRFQPPHDRGSSHGDTRITRLALGEGSQYVQFARRSHEIWHELERETGQTLLREVGGLYFGSANTHGQAHGSTDFLQTTINVAREHRIPHEVLDVASMRERFPQFHFRDDERGCFEHSAGFVHPEACIAAQLKMAARHGVELRTDEQLIHWENNGGSVEVTTDRGTYGAAHLILTAGAWLPRIVPELASSARVLRQVLFWFEPDGPHELFTPERLPVYIRVPDAGTNMFYGFPTIDGPSGGLKIAGEQFDCTTDPDSMKTEVSAEEVVAMHAVASPHLRITSRCVRSVVCKYTVTPDFHFIIDHAPNTERVWLASACSGHGFKHSAAVGEALAEIVSDDRTKFDLSPFQLSRFASGSA